MDLKEKRVRWYCNSCKRHFEVIKFSDNGNNWTPDKHYFEEKDIGKLYFVDIPECHRWKNVVTDYKYNI